MKAVIGLGSNKGNRYHHLIEALQFLGKLSQKKLKKSAIYLTEPVGPSKRYFLNGVIEADTDLNPDILRQKLKNFEYSHGRDPRAPRWSARTIDLDIIALEDLVIRSDSLIIPHTDYRKRLFVLEPLRDIHPHWHDPQTGKSITTMLEQAPGLQLKRTQLTW